MTALPAALRPLLEGRTREVVSTGASAARVERWSGGRDGDLFLKYGSPTGPDPIGDEIARLRWMAVNALPVPRIVADLVVGDTAYMLTEGLPGLDASVPRADGSEPFTIRALAAALERLHATPVAGCPFVHSAAARVEEASRRVAAGFVEPLEFDEGRGTRDPAELLGVLIASHARLAARQTLGDVAPEGRVFTHGDYCLPNVILRDAPRGPRDSRMLSGFIDVGRAGVADPYQDLALATRSIARNLGARWVPVFFAEYGIHAVDAERIEFYTLLDEFF